MKEEILESCKAMLKEHIEKLLDENVRVAEIEIELFHYMKRILYKD